MSVGRVGPAHRRDGDQVVAEVDKGVDVLPVIEGIGVLCPTALNKPVCGDKSWDRVGRAPQGKEQRPNTSGHRAKCRTQTWVFSRGQRFRSLLGPVMPCTLHSYLGLHQHRLMAKLHVGAPRKAEPLGLSPHGQEEQGQECDPNFPHLYISLASCSMGHPDAAESNELGALSTPNQSQQHTNGIQAPGWSWHWLSPTLWDPLITTWLLET